MENKDDTSQKWVLFSEITAQDRGDAIRIARILEEDQNVWARPIMGIEGEWSVLKYKLYPEGV